MAIYSNDQNLKKTVISITKEFGINGIVNVIRELEARLSTLEANAPEPKPEEIKPRRGRPPKNG